MGKKCCVPGCKSNYNNTEEYTSVFKFPKEESRRKLWIKKINRDNFSPSASAVVCIKHFSEKFINREDKVVRPDGTILTVPRKKLELTKDAFPSIFKDYPSYLTHEPEPIRKKERNYGTGRANFFKMVFR